MVGWLRMADIVQIVIVWVVDHSAVEVSPSENILR